MISNKLRSTARSLLRAKVVPVLTAAIVGWISTAHAESDEIIFPGSRAITNTESPQNFALELRIGPYMPQIDTEPGLRGKPFDTMYGNAVLSNHSGPGIFNGISPTARFYGGAEISWQALRIPHFGTFGPGLGGGFTKMSAPAFQEEPLMMSPPQYLDSGDTSTLLIVPMYLVGVLRVDVLNREIGIPLVPYVKGGFGGAVWRASNSLGVSSDNGRKALGFSSGFHFAAGLAFDMGVLDRVAERDLDSRTGINHLYIFGEYMLNPLNGLFQAHALRVGTSTVIVGLTFEF